MITFADSKINVAQMISAFDGLENIVGKGESMVTSIFSFSHNVFKAIILRDLEIRDKGSK